MRLSNAIGWNTLNTMLLLKNSRVLSTLCFYCKWVKFWLLYEVIYTWERRAIGWSRPWSWPLDQAWRRRLDLGHWMMPWKRRKHSQPLDDLDPWGVGRSVDFHLVHLGSFDSSWPNLLLGLVKPNFINWTTHCLTYYSRKQSLNKGPILLLFYCSLRHLFKSSHLL